ncbi:hypothetical protein [Actinoplanes sp. NPDC026619]|uniref:hypothetical protein n=1 Tax=Actinoplanes sp. NPDC026619 TaxID=3155798 RepID=UPI0033C6E232
MITRQHIRNAAIYFGIGLIVATCGALTTWLVAAQLGDTDSAFIRAAWWLCGVIALVALIGLALTTGRYLWYRRRRSDLDAAGGEAYGELRARFHQPQDGTRDQ